MKNPRRTAGAAALGALALFPGAGAFASDAQTEIRLLKARLQQLEAKIARRAKEEKAAARAEAARPVPQPPPPVVQPVAGLPGPDRFFFKGVEIRPGGYIALETVWRSRWMGADIATPWQNIPYGFLPGGHTGEFRLSARPTRPILTIKADIDPYTRITGYLETDFLGAAQTANSNQSNSYNLRLRQAYANIESDAYGLQLGAGQMWSLVTMNSVGIKPDTTLQPTVIDHNYMPGYVWTRQPGIRITKDIAKQFWFALSAESSAATYALPGPTAIGTNSLPIIGQPVLLAPPVGGGLFNAANNYSFTRMPDFVAKAAWDATIADRTIHVEAFGLLRDITDRAFWGNHSQWGGGVGAGVVIPVVPKYLDVQFSGMTGRGVGRYGTAQISDATFQLSGAPQLIHERMALAGAVLHATPQTDLYAFAGGDFASKQPQVSGVGGSLLIGGYGNPLYSNIGCDFENDAVVAGVAANVSLLPCSGQTKSVRQLTGGVWHTFYQGPFGKLRAGAQYSHTVRDAFVGFGATPRGTENMVYTSLRYYPFDGPSAILAPVTK